ncbi:phage tail tape measure protein [Asticcacaulis machinosus]|uniref:Phage tail tape measure protein n=1 Tax=Asticcacaulis machinosus TaxID=2984211 RepID=A0ABT5HGK7_9CAUL|nr:phage tail tape measure protein [Asticcacaulis machinosus]MDC7675391.1 phage tail tape measure protein [Asticcacaulis machinosus]
MAERKLALLLQFKGVDGLSGVLKGIVGAGGAAQDKLRGLNHTLKEERKELKELQKAIGAVGVPTRQMVDDQRRLESQIAATTKKVNAQKDAISRVGRFSAMGDSARSKGTENITTGVAMAAPLFLAGKAAASFEDGMIDIRQKAGLTVAETKKLEGNILRAAKAAHQIPEAMRMGVDTLAGFGMTPQQAGVMIAPIGRAATAYRAEIADLAAASYANFDNLKVPINETARALDAMASAGKNGAFEIKDMATFFPNLTAQAQALGQRGVPAVADLSAALQIARKGAGSAEKAATNVENLLAKLNTEETEKKFAKMGVDLPKALKKAYAEGKTPLEAIAELTQKATGGDLSKVSKLFGDMQAQAALRPLVQNMEEYRRIRAEALKASGVVDQDFAIRSASAGTQARAIMGDLSRLALVVGTALMPAFSEVSGHIRTAADRFEAFASKNPQVISFIVKTIAVLAGLNIALGASRFAFGMVIGPIAHLYNGFLMLGKLGPVMQGIIGFAPRILQAFTIMRTAAIFLAQGIARAGLMLLANPIVLIITAIVAAVAIAGFLIYKNWDKIKSAFAVGLTYLQGLWGTFKTIGGNIMQGLIGGISDKIALVKSMITGIAGKVAGWFKGILGIHSPSRVFAGFGGSIAEGLRVGMRRGMDGPLGEARRMAEAVSSPFSGTSIRQSQTAAGAATQASGAIHIGSIPITINAAPGQSPDDIAATLERKLKDMIRELSKPSLASFRDRDD